MRLALWSLLIVGMTVPNTASAAVIYVNNLVGSDAFNGVAERPIDVHTGPVRTIARGLEYARSGDMVIIANTGMPYYESVSLVGRKHSNLGNSEFQIVGNGAVVSGLRLIPKGAWEKVSNDLWKMVPWRKAYYQLALDGETVPEFMVPAETQSLPSIPEGQWAGWKGAIYYQAAVLEDPNDLDIAFAYDNVGLTLYDVENVVIVGLNFRHFRLDGINAHDRCRNIILDNVASMENGRAGLVVGGTSDVLLRRGTLTGNRKESALITEFGILRLDETEVSKPPTLEK